VNRSISLSSLGYAWENLDHELFGSAEQRPVGITESNGYMANAGLGARYYLTNNLFVDLDSRYRYLSKLVNNYGQGTAPRARS
jgi:hypothetical protein